MGEQAKHYGKGVALHYEGTENNESEPSKSKPERFGGGEYYSTHGEKAAERDAIEAQIHQVLQPWVVILVRFRCVSGKLAATHMWTFVMPSSRHLLGLSINPTYSAIFTVAPLPK